MISMSDKTTSYTAMLSHRQGLAYPVATLRTILRRVLRGNLQHLTTSICSFARKDQKEGEPGYVGNCFGQVMVFHQASNIKRFHRNHIILTDDLKCGLVVEVCSFALHLLMATREKLSGFATAIGTFLAPRQFALRSLQLRLRRAKNARVVNYFTRTHRGEVFQSDINPNAVACLGEKARLILFDGEDDKPAIRLAFDRASLNLAFNRAAQANPATANFREMQLVAFQAKARLWVTKRIKSRLAFEARIAWRFSCFDTAKKRLESLVNPPQYVLCNLAVNLCDIFTSGLNLRQLCALIVVVNRNAVHSPRIPALLQCAVVQLAADVQSCLARSKKLRIHSQLVLVSFHVHNYNLVMGKRQELKALYHCVYRLHYHLVLTTKYRRKAISLEMMNRLREIFTETLQKWECELIEFNGEADHVHLLFEAHPKVELSTLVNNLKTVSSRLIRRDFPIEVRQVYWKPVFWHRSYCILTAGGAPLSIIRQYIENQGTEES